MDFTIQSEISRLLQEKDIDTIKEGLEKLLENLEQLESQDDGGEDTLIETEADRKMQKKLNDSKSTLEDKEVLTWLQKSYTNYASMRTKYAAPPMRSPLQRFQKTAQLLVKEIRIAKALGHGKMKRIQRPGLSRASLNPGLMSTIHLTELALSNKHVTSVLKKHHNMNEFDIFMFAKLSHVRAQPLLVMAEYLARESRFMGKFQIPVDKFQCFLHKIEINYKNNPYHNNLHAADVLNTCEFFVHSHMFQTHCSDLDHLCLFIAALIHDVGHTGHTNTYHINTQSTLALRYNDRSVLENYHLATAFMILKDSKSDFTENLTKEERKYFREAVIQLVLGTDMRHHNKHVFQLEKMVDIMEASEKANEPFELQEFSGGPMKPPRISNVFSEKLFLMELAVHASDISNPGKPVFVSKEWTRRITDEFFLQGDQERNKGMEISPMCDRHKPNVAKASIGFIDFIVAPLFNSLARIIPECQVFVENVGINKKYWKEHPGCNEIEEYVPIMADSILEEDSESDSTEIST